MRAATRTADRAVTRITQVTGAVRERRADIRAALIRLADIRMRDRTEQDKTAPDREAWGRTDSLTAATAVMAAISPSREITSTAVLFPITIMALHPEAGVRERSIKRKSPGRCV